MKILVMGFCLLIALSNLSIADEIETTDEDKTVYLVLGDVPAYVYNTIFHKQIPANMSLTATIEVEDKKAQKIESIHFCVNETTIENCFLLETEEMISFLKLVNKYREWEKKAASKNDKFQKTIGTVNAITTSHKLFGQHYPTSSQNLELIFFTKKPKDYQFIISMPNRSTSIMQIPSTDFYISTAGVKVLLTELNNNNIKTKLKKYFEEQSRIKTEYK
ncbi:MAG: hypothetical protein IPM57_03895 [Oligoflexia bacterium]|nr:hypothetical protein [Oligoflexia bacterium]